MILGLFSSLYFCFEFKDIELIKTNSVYRNVIIPLLSFIILLLNAFR